jgi:hypothetical protein
VQTAATFKLYQQQMCRQLQQARARLTARDFTGSLAVVERIDPQSPCAVDTRQLIIDQATRETASDKSSSEMYLNRLR